MLKSPSGKTEYYVCSYCNSRTSSSRGKPMPGICHARPKDSNGRSKPHVWVKVG